MDLKTPGKSSKDPLARATALAQEAEDREEEGLFGAAVARFEAASEAYVSATLLTADTKTVQELRLLALSHAQRALELRLRMRLRDACTTFDADAPLDGAAPAVGDSGGGAGSESKSAKPPGSSGGASWSSAENVAANGALSRVGSQLISTHEELRFGAEELTRLLAHSTAGSPIAGSQALMGTKLIDSFCVVPSQRTASTPGGTRFGEPLGASPAALQQSVMGCSCPVPTTLADAPAAGVGGAFIIGSVGAAGGSSTSSGGCGCGDGPRPSSASFGSDGEPSNDLRASLAQLSTENGKLARENAMLRQRATEVQGVLAKAQRRAADQQRLVRKALSALREVHAAPRPELAANAATEIADLRRQLEAAHTAKRQQAELVRKYEQRWAQLKASARRKQQAQQAQNALQQKQ